MNSPISLALFAGLSVNLLVQMGLGLRDFTREQERSWIFGIFHGFIITGSVMLLWILFSFVCTPLSLGFLEYLLALPILALLFQGLDWAYRYFFQMFNPSGNSETEQELSSHGPLGYSPYYGVILAALFITLRLAQTFGDALALSLSFSLGTLFSVLLVKAIHKRIALERLPQFLRGLPLLLLSLGFLALIYSAISITLFN